MLATLRRLPFRAVLLALLLAQASAAAPTAETRTVGRRQLLDEDRVRVDAAIAALAPQRPGHIDLYAVGFAGDATEDVFRNEVLHFETLMARRFDADHRTVGLVNHVDSLLKRPRPLATLDNLRHVLAGVGRRMDREEDVLLLFLTMHGSREHRLYVTMPPLLEEEISPDQLRAALDDAGIRHRVIVVSACFSGGFVPALRSPDTLVLTAARKDRTSFGCGSESAATYFGRAWMIEGLNETTDFIDAMQRARPRIAERERELDEAPSLPQMDIGRDIPTRLRAWRAGFQPGPPVAFAPPASPKRTFEAESAQPEVDDPDTAEPAPATRRPGTRTAGERARKGPRD